jgi:hypothetical protein
MLSYPPVRVHLLYGGNLHAYGFLYLCEVATTVGRGNQVWVQMENSDLTLYVKDASILSMHVLYGESCGCEDDFCVQ